MCQEGSDEASLQGNLECHLEQWIKFAKQRKKAEDGPESQLGMCRVVKDQTSPRESEKFG